jgi:hypothetical protein
MFYAENVASRALHDQQRIINAQLRPRSSVGFLAYSSLFPCGSSGEPGVDSSKLSPDRKATLCDL